MNSLYTCPQVLAFLQAIKEHPEDDTPRLILADWLDDHGDAGRGEFIRLQCRLVDTMGRRMSQSRRQAAQERIEALLDRYGGTWAGPLWNWRPGEYSWHRGLLAIRLVRPLESTEALTDVLPWVDTLHSEVHGWQMLHEAAELLDSGIFNHAGFSFRRSAEPAVLECLARIRESPCLRKLTFWCVRPAGRRPAGSVKSALRPSPSFLTSLVRKLPVARHLVRVAIGPGLSAEEADLLRELDLKPVEVQGLDWMQASGA